MRIQEISEMINHALQDEAQHSRFAAKARAAARSQGDPQVDDYARSAVEAVSKYILLVPFYLQQAYTRASELGLRPQLNQMVAELEDYWFTTNDLIPDTLGLEGLLDDAYATLTLLQALSDICVATTGRPLLEKDLKTINRFMRQVMSEPIAAELDRRVGLTMANALWPGLLASLTQGGFQFNSGPSYSDIQRTVDVQLGAMGVL